MTKYEKFYNVVFDILRWAVNQKHINEDQYYLLEQNIESAKEDIDAEAGE